MDFKNVSMDWTIVYKKINHFLLLSVSEFMCSVVRFFQKDAATFMKTYPVLAMEPLVAWKHLWSSVRQFIGQLKDSIPDFIPIAFKLAFAFSLIIVVGLVGLGSSLGINQTKLLENQTNHFGEVLALQASYSIKEPLLAEDHFLIEMIVGKLINTESIDGVSVFSDELSLVFSSGFEFSNELLTKKVGEGLFKKDDVVRIESADKDIVTYVVPIVHGQLFIGYVALSFDVSALKTAKIETRNTVIWITALTLFFGVLATFYLSKQMVKPIARLLDMSRAMQSGDFKYKFEKDLRNDELGVLMSALNKFSDGLLEKEKVEKIFSRYVSPQVASLVLNDLNNIDAVKLGGEHVEASVFFADIVGFTSLSETMEPQEVSHLLNIYFSKVAEAVNFCGGHVDKYMGDCAMVVFGVPLKNDDHAFKSIACGWMILRLIERLNEKRKAEGKLIVEFRIGANSGTVLAGNMGSEERMEYTVVGDAVNLASRLANVAKPMELVVTELVVREHFLEKKVTFEMNEIIPIRGKKLPVRTLSIKDISTPFRDEMISEIERIVGW